MYRKKEKLAREKFDQTYLIEAFETKMESQGFLVHGTTIMGRGKDRRVVIHAQSDSDLDRLEATAKKIFGEVRFEILPADDIAESTIGINNGGGIQVANSNEIGTLGGIFQKEGETGLFGISNNHVLSHCNQQPLGSPIADANGQQLGQLFQTFQLKDQPNVNAIDAAIFKLNPNLTGNWTPADPSGTIRGQVSWRVYKQGFRTQFTQGTIKGVKGKLKIRLCGKVYLFGDLMLIEGFGNQRFSDSGDSGSLVFTVNHKITGIVLAKLRQFSLACPIQYIENLKLIL